MEYPKLSIITPIYQRNKLYTVGLQPSTATRSSGGNTNKQGLNTTNGYFSIFHSEEMKYIQTVEYLPHFELA